MELDLKFDRLSKEKIRDYPDKIVKVLQKGFNKARIDLEGQSKKNFGRPGQLKVRTGHLRRSIYSQSTGFLKGHIGSDAKYAAIHQYGGIIRPRVKKALKFKVGDRWVTTQRVRIPTRPFIMPHRRRAEKRFVKIMGGIFEEGFKE